MNVIFCNTKTLDAHKIQQLKQVIATSFPLKDSAFEIHFIAENNIKLCIYLDENESLISFISYQALDFQSEDCSPDKIEIEILDIAVLPQYRRQGIAKEMLKQLIAKHKKNTQKNSTKIFLEVAQDNTHAISLYDKLGFKIQSIRKNYYKKHDNYVDAINMSLII